MKKSRNILFLLLIAFVVRLLLHPFGTLQLDHGTFVAWSNNLAQNGLSQFYTGWSDYLPGYVYVLWFLGNLNASFSLPTEFLYKLPAIIADVITGYLIYRSVLKLPLSNKGKETIALLASSFYLFNPAIIANSTLWGQVDSLTALFSLASIYMASVNPLFSAALLAIGTLIKPQAALTLLVILFMMYQQKWKITNIFNYLVMGLLVFCLGFLPFTTLAQLPQFIAERLSVTLNQYKYTSVNAFNFWGLGGFWSPDEGQNIIGWIVTILASLVAAFKLRKVKDAEYLLSAFVLLVGFLFMTRLHERHALPILAPLIIATTQYPQLLFSYILISFSYVTNLYYAYVWISENFRNVFSPFQTKVFIGLNLLAFTNIAATVIRQKSLISQKLAGHFPLSLKEVKERSPQLPDMLSAKKVRTLLFLIVLFSVAARFLFLYNPAKEYFDEVYHAFTARVLLHNDPKGWEWWNPHPEGFAYEWTHPPMAKIMMIIGMSILGENAIGWRAPSAILGVVCVVLVYAIARKLFDRRDIGLLSAGLFALDGLPLVMSRIGMNDTYFLVSVLAAFYFYLLDRNLFSAIFLGFAAASKWSTMWFLPILAVTHFALRKKIRPSYIWFFVIPPVIYLASYIPFFTSGHSWEQFVELQKQMWWYHTGLKAEHGYSSAWWSWPLLIRPIWLFVERQGSEMVANIYAMGNPIIFWFGVTSIVSCAYWAIGERNKKLGLIVFSYLAFFVTWATSPRIMFMYHYLPAIPFMAIAGGYMLKRHTWLIVPILVVAGFTFIYFYPHWTGIMVPEALDRSYYWFPSWR